MRAALDGVPEHQMAQPEGIVSVRIDRDTGCPARAGQANATFEFFREGHVPTCETAEALHDIFNDTSGTDPLDESYGDEDQAEPLF